MLKMFLYTSLSVFMAIGLILTGCSNQQPSQQSAGSREAAPDQPAAAGHEHAEHSGHEDALAELSPEDRALAEKQKVCPVSGETLGAMGKPYKVTVKGQEVLLCCPGCEAEIKKDPEKYMAKLPK